MPTDKLEYNLIRSKRRSYALELSPSGELTVRVPNYYSDPEIKDIITKHRNWIEKNIVKTKEKLINAGLDRFFKCEMIFFRGEELEVFKVISSKNRVERSRDRIVVYKKESALVRPLIVKWLKEQAREIFTDKLDHFSKTFSLSYRGLKLSDAKKRWGSCSSKKNINLSWRLVMAEDELIDSVIMHELAHTIHMDHSKNFYQLLSRMNPMYLKHDEMIKDRFYLLNF